MPKNEIYFVATSTLAGNDFNFEIRVFACLIQSWMAFSIFFSSYSINLIRFTASEKKKLSVKKLFGTCHFFNDKRFLK